ncbi:MAG: Bcr/CflA family efflux MFS transporter [Pseudoxanthomonas sp.]
MSLRAIRPSSPLYVVMLGLLSALPPFGTDAGLPGLPALQAEFGIGVSQAAQTLTLFLLGFALGPVLFGPLSDRYGRKPVLLLGVALFSAATLGCALAGSMHTLLALRVLGGVGAGAAASLPAAIVRDVYRDEQGLSRQSYVALVNGVAPLLAPLLGAALLACAGWRGIYATLAVLGAALFALAAFGYAETAPLDAAAPRARGGALGATAAGYRAVLGDRRYLLATGVLAAVFGTMFAYITGSSAVFMDVLGASPTVYAALFAATAAGTIAGAACNTRLARHWGPRRVLAGAVAGNLLACAVLLGAAGAGLQSIVLTAVLVVASNFCAGIVMPLATHASLRDLGRNAGSAAALQRGLQMVAGAGSGALVGLTGAPPLLAMALAMAASALLALVLLLVLQRTKPAAVQTCACR